MDLFDLRPGLLVECFVLVFQVVGLAGLAISRLLPDSAWASRGRAVLLLAMVGLGVAGAVSGRADSAFGLFAGVTMTVLLIGGIVGGGADVPVGRSLPVGLPQRLAR